MVTVIGFIVETEEGDSYVRLILYGDLEIDQSEKTGSLYATTRKAIISATFNEVVAQSIIGN